MRKLFFISTALFFGMPNYAQVGINTENPHTALDVNGSIQLRKELRVNGNPGEPGEIYFSKGNIDEPEWKEVNVPFLEEGQYQLINTYAVSDETGIDWVGNAPSIINSFPFTETFETDSPTRDSWANQRETSPGSDWSWGTGDGGGTNQTGNVRNTAHGGTVNARFVTNNGRITKYISPVLDLTNLTDPKLTFWYGQRASSSNGSNQNYLKVYYRTSPSSDWEEILYITTRTPNWTQATVNLPEKSATYQIAFEGIARGSRSNVIDDITVSGSLPFVETFEEDSPTRNLWTNLLEVVVNGNGDWEYVNNGTTYNNVGPQTPHGGSRNAFFRDFNPPGQVTKLVTPLLNLSGSINPKVRFYYAQPNWVSGGTTYQNILKIYYRTSSSSSWVLLNTYNDNITVWTEETLALPNPSSTYQIAFEATNNYGYPTLLDDVAVFGDNTTPAPSEGYDGTLSTIGETISSKNWKRIAGLDLPITIGNDDNKISVIFQTGVESRMNATGTGTQVGGNIRYTCGLFRRETANPLSSAVLVAVRADQINNTFNKDIENKAQSIFTLTYTVNNTPAGDYTFSVACRRLSLTDGGGSEGASLLSIGNSVNSGNNVTNDFMLSSILKMDIIELITVTGF